MKKSSKLSRWHGLMKESDTNPFILLKRNLNSEKDTETIATQLAAQLKPGDCITFAGDLGVGKTAFIRAMVQALSQQSQEVVSPTFLLMQQYDVTVEKNTPCQLFHFDLYRLEDKSELAELALEETLEDGIVCIEWADIAADMLPDDKLAICMDYGDKEGRRYITLSGNTDWKARLAGLSLRD